MMRRMKRKILAVLAAWGVFLFVWVGQFLLYEFSPGFREFFDAYSWPIVVASLLSTAIAAIWAEAQYYRR